MHAASMPLQVSFLAFAAPGVVGAIAIGVFLWHQPGRLPSPEVMAAKPVESTTA
ncbi:hypothetical protein D3C84_1185670 [compost metagenome]